MMFWLTRPKDFVKFTKTRTTAILHYGRQLMKVNKAVDGGGGFQIVKLLRIMHVSYVSGVQSEKKDSHNRIGTVIIVTV